MGWAGKRNGELLKLAEHEFDVFLTVDRSLQHQQHLATFQIAVVVMLSPSNSLSHLYSLIPAVLQVLTTAKVGEATVVGA